MTKTKPKTRSVTMTVLGAVPYSLPSGLYWRVRMKAPYFPFFVDSSLFYKNKPDADAAAVKWKRRKIVVKITG